MKNKHRKDGHQTPSQTNQRSTISGSNNSDSSDETKFEEQNASLKNSDGGGRTEPPARERKSNS